VGHILPKAYLIEMKRRNFSQALRGLLIIRSLVDEKMLRTLLNIPEQQEVA